MPELRLTATFVCFFCPCRPSAAHWSTARASASSQGRFTYGHVTSANTAGWPTVSLDRRSCGVNKGELTRSLDSRKICLTAHQVSVLGIGFETHCAEKPGSHFFFSSCSCIRLLFFFSLFLLWKFWLLCNASKKKKRKRKRGESNHRKTHYQAQVHTL